LSFKLSNDSPRPASILLALIERLVSCSLSSGVECRELDSIIDPINDQEAITGRGGVMSIFTEASRSLTSPSTRLRWPSDDTGVSLTCLLLFAMSCTLSSQLSCSEPVVGRGLPCLSRVAKNENG